MISSQHSIMRAAVILVSSLAASSALAMPFCGNKGYKGDYGYTPAFAYPAAMPAYSQLPMLPPHVHSWNRVNSPPAATAVPRQQTARAETTDPASR